MAEAPEIDPRELAERLGRGELTLVDVREDDEWEAGRIAGARHVPLGQLAERAEEIERDRPVVFYCRVGNRSAMASEAFRQAGWDARNLGGGVVAWDEQGLPLDPDGGTVATPPPAPR